MRSTLALAAAAAAGSPLPAGPGQPPESGPDAAGHRHLRRAGRRHREGLQAARDEQGGKLGGREIQYFKVDDESDPAKATDNVNKLIKRDQVDVVVGTVHSGVALAMARAAKESNTLLIVPNAGADAITGPLCAPNIFRSSFSNWQPGYATGVMAAQKGYKRAMTITWNYAAGNETVKGFTEAFEKGGGKVIKDLTCPSPTSSSRPC
jgi:branched-chain amino acid transport system substrate-binding protein